MDEVRFSCLGPMAIVERPTSLATLDRAERGGEVESVVPEESLVLCYVFEALSFVLIVIGHVGCANLAKGCVVRADECGDRRVTRRW